MSAAELLRQMEHERPEVIRLAEAVSLAILIDPPLLRKARLVLVPEADPGAEADLWLSSLVESQGPDGIVFPPDVAEELRTRLAKDPERLRQAWEITDSLHQHLSPAVRLEEEIAWLSVSPDPRAADRIEDLLRSVLAAMIGGERRGLAHWVARALPALPSGVRIRAAETLRMLDTGARLRLSGGVEPDKEEEKMPDWLPWVTPADLKRVPVRVRLFPDTVELDARPEATGNILELPETDPLLVELSWRDDKKERRQVVFRKGELRRIEPVRAKHICLQTILGEVYDLHESHQPPRGLQADWIDFSEERARHRPLFGRGEALETIETWAVKGIFFTTKREGEPRFVFDSRTRVGSRFFLVLGVAGAGKTALLSNVIDRLQERSGAAPPHHFFRRGDPRLEDLGSAERSLIAQVAAHFPALATAAARLSLADLLDQLSLRNLISFDRPLILVLDGLDQARLTGGTHPLDRLFPRDLPAGVMVLASWETELLASPYSKWPVRHRLQVEEGDLQEYWDFHTSKESSWAIEASELARLSQHNFGTAEILRRWNELRPLDRNLREGLVYLWQSFQPTWGGDLVWGGDLAALGLGALAIAFGPLPEAVLIRVVGPDDNLMERASVLVLTTLPEGGRSYSLLNDAARRFVLSHFDQEALARIHRQCAPPLNPPREGWLPYELRYGIDHLLAAGDRERAGELCCSAEFLTAKCQRIGIEDALRDLQNWLETSNPQDDKRRRIVRSILRFMLREQDRLRRTPEELPALLYNWLRAAEGLTPERISKQLRIPEAPAFRVKRPLGKKELSLDRAGMKRHGGPVMGVQRFFHGSEPSLLSWSTDGTLRIWHLASGSLAAVLEGHGGEVTGCRILDHRSLAVSSSRDGTLRVWDLEKGQATRILVGHEGEVLGVKLTEDREQRAVSRGADGTLRVWDLETGSELAVLAGHQGPVTACWASSMLSEDEQGNWTMFEGIISGSEDTTVRLWNLDSGELLQSFAGHSAPITAVFHQADDQRIFSCSLDRTVKVWGTTNPEPLRASRPELLELSETLQGHSSGILGGQFYASHLVTWSYDRTIRVWDLMEFRGGGSLFPSLVESPEDRILQGHEGAVLDCAFSPDGSLLASGSADRTVRVWSLGEGREVARFEGHMGAVRCVRFISDQVVVSGSEDRTLRVWNLGEISMNGASS